MIESNVIHASYTNKVKRLLFLGSSCLYPKAVAQPMREEALLTDTLEPTNEPEVVVWGSGKPKREFLYVDDMASASIHVLELDKKIYQKNTEPMLSALPVQFRLMRQNQTAHLVS